MSIGSSCLPLPAITTKEADSLKYGIRHWQNTFRHAAPAAAVSCMTAKKYWDAGKCQGSCLPCHHQTSVKLCPSTPLWGAALNQRLFPCKMSGWRALLTSKRSIRARVNSNPRLSLAVVFPLRFISNLMNSRAICCSNLHLNTKLNLFISHSFASAHKLLGVVKISATLCPTDWRHTGKLRVCCAGYSSTVLGMESGGFVVGVRSLEVSELQIRFWFDSTLLQRWFLQSNLSSDFSSSENDGNNCAHCYCVGAVFSSQDSPGSL